MKQDVLEMITGARRNKAGVPMVRTPQFPGVNPNMSIEQVRAVIRKQVRSKGFVFGISNGSNSFDIDLSGTARVFLGFALTAVDPVLADTPRDVTITINNEIVIDRVPPNFFSEAFMDDEYFYFPRPLSGQDTIVFDVTGVADFELLAIVYYI